MRSGFIIFCFVICANSVLAQTNKTVGLFFIPLFGKSDLKLEQYYKLGVDSVMIESLRFYISGIELKEKDKVAWIEPNSFHLIDLANEKTLDLSLLIPSGIHFTQVKFNLGIDSSTNVSGALGGDLDPTKGMYWAWQSGYINFKLEGKSNICKTRGNEFQLHLGGYQAPFNNLRTVSLNIASAEKAVIALDVEQLLRTVDLSQQHHIMSPCAEANVLSERLSKIFSIQPNEK
ncbi:MAG: MbnP family protein [Bacteroidota bacterium]